MFDYTSDFGSANVDWSASATYTETEVTGVRDTPPELGTQPLFDQRGAGGSAGHGAEVPGEPRRGVRMGPLSRSACTSSSTVRRRTTTMTAARPTARSCSTRTEIGVTPITNLEVSFEAMERLTITRGRHQRVRQDPDKRNDALPRDAVRGRRQQRGGGVSVVLAVRHQRRLLLRRAGLSVLKSAGKARAGASMRPPSFLLLLDGAI